VRFERKRIFITVKAYPAPSRRHGEIVCCAGIDLNNLQFVRLYPVPFRDLDIERKFRKYSIIDVDCSRPIDDHRPESFKVNPNTIEVVDWISTKKNGWERRKSIVLELPVRSMCQVCKDLKERGLSLALIKPIEISFEWAKRSLSNQKSREDCYAQLGFFNKAKDAIEEIPFRFYYRFSCGGEACCPAHKLSIIDWEIGQAYRDWRSTYKTESILLEKIQQRWLDIADIRKRDVYFYVGNMQRFRDTFMVLGVFSPPRNG
jgi:hypothetical protein